MAHATSLPAAPTTRLSLRAALARLALLLVVATLGQLAPRPASAEQALHQIRLTEDIVERFLKAQKDLATIAHKLPSGSFSGDGGMKRDVRAEVLAIARKHGFKDFAEIELVASNISLVMSGLDEASGKFRDPAQDILDALAKAEADANLPPTEKAQLIKDLKTALAAMPTLKFPENVAMVKHYLSKARKAQR
ncbi:MAG: hypothetical protein AB7E70_10685 [Hyphomicrobiaceae bacterium]